MTYSDHIEARFERCAARLGLSHAATEAMGVLVSLDLDPSMAPADPHGRQGVVGWDRLYVGLVEKGFTPGEVEEGVNELADWRLAQIVGREANDPVVSGPAAVRLTSEGRACVGLAPVPHYDDAAPEGADEAGWLVLHGASRERLMSEASGHVGHRAFRPLVAVASEGVSRLAGGVALSLCASGCVVVDATSLSDGERASLVPEMLWRTRKGAGLRVLLAPSPVPARVPAADGGVRLRWVEPRSNDKAADLDAEISRTLVEGDPDAVFADVCGVPGGQIALPRRVDVSFDDIVVPEGVRQQLEQVRMHAHYRLEILPTLTAFKGRGSGYRLLLSGLPGTGKSMTAEALATLLNRSLVKLDLSAVLSKWLGETEQLIGQVFDMAEAAGSVLVLDEAESLFRQRQSGAQGANALSTAVAYLLTRLERFSGVLCATTNRTQDVDEAFFRRFNDYLILPMPDAAARQRLWEMMLVNAGTADLSGLDVGLLAEQFTVSGGLIRGAAIRATAWAAGLDQPLDMPVLLAALGRELEKSDRSAKAVQIEPYAADVRRYLQVEG